LNHTPLTLDQLLSYARRALGGDRRLLAQLFRQMQRLANLPEAPPEERALGEVMSRILIGERQPDLSALPDDMAGEIRQWLHGIEPPGD
jgi:hypothetical protein